MRDSGPHLYIEKQQTSQERLSPRGKFGEHCQSSRKIILKTNTVGFFPTAKYVSPILSSFNLANA